MLSYTYMVCCKTSAAWSVNWLVWEFRTAIQLSVATLCEMERSIRYNQLSRTPGVGRTQPFVAGDLFYVYVLGNPIIVINSTQVAEDLLEKRSGNYSSRYICILAFYLLNH